MNRFLAPSGHGSVRAPELKRSNEPTSFRRLEAIALARSSAARSARERQSWPRRLVAQLPLPPRHVVPAIELPPCAAEHADLAEAERLVETDAPLVRKADAGVRSAEALRGKHAEQRLVERTPDPLAAAGRRQVGRYLDAVAVRGALPVGRGVGVPCHAACPLGHEPSPLRLCVRDAPRELDSGGRLELEGDGSLQDEA